MAKTFELADAIVRKIHREATEADLALIEQWLQQDKGNELLYQKILRDEDNVLELLQRVDSGSALIRLKRRAEREGRQKWTIVAIAASVVVMVSLYLFDRSGKSGRENLTKVQTSDGTVRPATQRAMLVMSDGKQFPLDGSIDTAFQYGELKIEQVNGRLVYEQSAVQNAAAMQELITPKAGRYHIQLSDGTNVWLNAASRLRFPQHFGPKDRTVELFGEGYFEVSKDAEHPFRVISEGSSTIEVLGTVFNVKGYHKEEVTTTLLEGSVRISKDEKTRLLKVGEMAKVSGNVISISKGDIPAATAWRQDRFMFHQMAIGEMMEEIARWYDVQLDYEASYRSRQELYTGEIDRNVTLDKLLAMLEETGVAKFKLRERTITISPK